MVSSPTYICVTRPQWVNSLRPGDILQSIHSNSFSSLIYGRSCIEMISQRRIFRLDVNIGSGNGLVPADSKPLPDLNQVHDTIWHHYASDELMYIIQCRHYNCRWPGIFSTLAISRHGTNHESWIISHVSITGGNRTMVAVATIVSMVAADGERISIFPLVCRNKAHCVSFVAPDI